VSESIMSPVEMSNRSPLDLIEELRLRRWARRNYVPAEQRGGEWHPIVLDEMLTRDRELVWAPVALLSDESSTVRPIGRQIVPLPPTHLNVVHEAHEVPPEPNLSSAAVPLTVEWVF
jgi:hypothetical protein